MLTAEEARSLIQAMYTERAVPGKNTTTLASLVNTLVRDTLSGDRYLGELLQNADDARSAGAEFILCGEHLIFKHQGKQFDADDFRGICDAASPERAKLQASDQIGNKGIGFKSVFSMASVVRILSKNLCFRFDETFETWRKKPQDYPWQIIPIQTERSDLPEGVRQYCDDDSVHFIFSLRPGMLAEIQQHLSGLSTQQFLFLRSVKKVIVRGLEGVEDKTLRLNPPERQCVDAKQKDDFTIERIKVNDKVAWWTYRQEYALPADLISTLKASQVADKYKQLKTLPICIAIREENGKLVPIKRGPRVFCYLPTGLDFKFHFLCNAEFFLDSSRMQLGNSPVADAWNGCILKNIVEAHLRFLSVMSCRTGLWRSVFSVLTDSFAMPEKFQPACKAVFDQLVQKVHLVVNMPAKKIAYIKGCKIDLYGFIAAFGDDALKEECAHPEIENQEFLKNLGAPCFGITEILAEIIKSRFTAVLKNPESNRQFLQFLVQLSSRLDETSRKKLEKAFKENPFILTNKTTLKTPAEVFLPNETLKYATRDFAFVETIHPVLSKMSEAEQQWLQTQGVKPLSLGHLITMANKSQEELPAFALCLFDVRQKLDEADLKKLTQLNVLVVNKKGLAATGAYLPDALGPKQKLGDYLGPDNGFLLHSDYYTGLAPECYEELKTFLRKIGVSTQITEKNLAQVVNAANQVSDPEALISLTLILFDKFFQQQEPSDETLKSLKELKLVSQHREILSASACYLADIYEPQEKLEALVPELACVSDQYCQDGVDIETLKRFFLALGVQETVKLSLSDTLYRLKLEEKDPAAKEYFKYLDEVVPDLCPPATRRYMYQHYVTGVYVQISFINNLVSTPVFWRCLVKHWQQFGDTLGRVTYETARGSKEIPSNIHYLADVAVKKAYGDDKSIADFFGHEVKRILQEYTGDLAVAEITEGLSLAQLSLLGFKTDLTREQCQSLLNAIAAANKSDEDLEKITFVYDNLLRLASEHAAPEPFENLSLLNRVNQFRPANLLYYIVGDYLPDSHNEHLIKKPAKFKTEEFSSICRFMGVKLIAFPDLKPEVLNERASSLDQHIRDRWEYLIAAVATQHGWAGEERRSKSLDLFARFQTKQLGLSFCCAQQLRIVCSDFLQESVDLWIDKENNSVFHMPLEELDHVATQTLYQFLFSYFELDCTDDAFLSIMTLPLGRLQTKYAHDLGGCDLASLETLQGQKQLEKARADLAEQATEPARSQPSRKRQLSEEGSEDEEEQEEQVDDVDWAASASAASGGALMEFEETEGAAAAGGGLIDRAWKPAATARASGSGAVVSLQQARKKRVIAARVSPEIGGGFFSERFTEEQRKAIGRAGEEAVYNDLKTKHTKKHAGSAGITEDENSYTITFADGRTKKVTWLNKQAEAYKPYDFEIVVRKADGSHKIRHLEVKTTTSNGSEIDVMYSAGEWRAKEEDESTEGRSHRLFVVKASISDGGDLTVQDVKKVDLRNPSNCTVNVAEVKKVSLRF